MDVVYESTDEESFVKVKDTGVGMTRDKLRTLFDIKTNKSTEGTSREKGSGLGLILTKQLVEQAGGKIEVNSTPGKGSEFVLRFKNIHQTELA